MDFSLLRDRRFQMVLMVLALVGSASAGYLDNLTTLIEEFAALMPSVTALIISVIPAMAAMGITGAVLAIIYAVAKMVGGLGPRGRR